MPVTQAQCEDVMRRLGLPFASVPGRLTVAPPSWRFDLRVEEDLIEEVIRVLGYHMLPDTPPTAALTAHVRSETRRSDDTLRRALANLGYRESINFSFVDERWERELAGNPDPIRVVNPMSSQLSVMRSSLIGSLIGVMRFNLVRKTARIRTFEIGRVFLRDAAAVDSSVGVAGVRQPVRLAGLACGAVDELQWGASDRSVDYFDAKGDVEALLAPRIARFVAAEHPAMHPGRCALVELDGRGIGFIGELHPQWRQAYELPVAPIVFELDADALMARDLPVFVPVQRHQSVWRDLSLIASEAVTHDSLSQTIRGVNAELIRSTRLFDIYRPPEATGDIKACERSLSVRLELLDDAVTLTDERVDAVIAKVLAELGARLGVRLRA
jgi:phenylalanyl-tRNA synthetase beta chain